MVSVAQLFCSSVQFYEVRSPHQEKGCTLAVNLDVFRSEHCIRFLNQYLLSSVNIFSFSSHRCHLLQLNFQALPPKKLSGSLPIQILEASECANDLQGLFN